MPKKFLALIGAGLLVGTAFAGASVTTQSEPAEAACFSNLQWSKVLNNYCSSAAHVAYIKNAGQPYTWAEAPRMPAGFWSVQTASWLGQYDKGVHLY